MAQAIKGITVEIGGNTAPLEKALEGVNSKSRDLQRELVQVEKLLKLDPSNTELVAQKQKLLADAVENTGEKLDKLKIAEQQAQEQFKKGDISEQQYRALQREIIKTEQDLKSYENQIKDVGTESQKTANKTKEIGDESDKAHPRMKAFGAGSVVALTAITAAATGVIAGIGNITKKVVDGAIKMADYADEVNTLSRMYKVSTTELQKLGFAAELVDVPMETMGSSLGKLTKAMGKAHEGTEAQVKAFDKLKVSFVDGNGKFRDSYDVFLDVIDALGEMENETEADIVANDLFGRSFQDLNPLIAEGSEKLRELGEKAEALGLILGPEQLETLNNFKDTLDVLRAQVMLAAAPFVEALAPAFTEIAGVIGEKLGDEKVKETLGVVGEKIGALALAITDGLIEFLGSDAFSEMAEGLLALGGSLTEDVTEFLTTGLPDIKEKLDWFMQNKGEIAIVTAGLGGLVAVLSAFTLNAPGVAAGLAMVAGAFTLGGNEINAGISYIKLAFVMFIDELTTKWTDFWLGVALSVEQANNNINIKVVDFANGLITAINSLFGALNNVLSALNLKQIELLDLLEYKQNHKVRDAMGQAGYFGTDDWSTGAANWHAEGAIFMKPTLLSATDGSVHGVGDTRLGEAVLPIENLGGMIADVMERIAPPSDSPRNVITIHTNTLSEAQIDYIYDRFDRRAGA